MKQKGLAPLVIIILIALAVGGYLLYQKQLKPAVVQLTTQSPPAPTVSDETANWKTYTNAEYKFSFKYPSTWVFEDSSEFGLGQVSERRKSGYQLLLDDANHTTSAGDGKTMIAGAVNMMIYNKDNYKFFSDNLNDYHKNSQMTDTKLSKLNGLGEIKEIHHKTCPANNDCISVIFKKDGNVFNFDTWIWNDRYRDLDIIYQILSTFKFTQ